MARLASATVIVVLAVAATAAIHAAGEKPDKPAPAGAGASSADAPGTSGGADRDAAAGLPKQWIDAADVRIRSQSADLSRWWQVFNDPLLDKLIQEAYSQNVTLQKAKARSEQAHSPLDYDEALVSVLADVAADYVLIRQCQEQIHRAKENVQLQTDALKIVKARWENGRTSELDVDQAVAVVAQTEAQVPRLEIQLRKAENRLCVLLGKPPTDLQPRLGVAAVPASPSEATVGTPSEILQRRPDIQRAQHDSSLTYRDTLLRASEEVENGIAGFLHAHEQAKRTSDGLTAARKALMVAVAQYRVGTVDFNTVAKVERDLAELANQETEARAQIALGLIQTYRALGGGWQIRLGQAASSSLPLPPAASKMGPTPVSSPIPQLAPAAPALPGALPEPAPLPPPAPAPPAPVPPRPA